MFEDDDGESLGYCQFHFIEDMEDIEGLFPPGWEEVWPDEWPSSPGRYPIRMRQISDDNGEWAAWAVVDG